MRALMILALISWTHARPDVSLGYKYEKAGSHSAFNFGLSPPPSSPSSNNEASISSSSNNEASISSSSNNEASISSFGQGYATGYESSNHNSQPFPNFGASNQFIQTSTDIHHQSQSSQHTVTATATQAQRNQEPIVTKQFYVHAAPEDTDNIPKRKHFILGRPQKNYRVVFIKAPTSTNANVKLSAEYAPQEEKTIIYVLNQKEHELDVSDIATPAPTQPSKPEVFFIKYNTQEEAAHAQAEIQKQYDVLGGETQVTNEGPAPISSVIGSLDRNTDSSTNALSYLPPAQ